MEVRNVLKIRAKFFAIAYGNLYSVRLRTACSLRALLELTQNDFHVALVYLSGIKRHHQRGVRRLKISQPVGRVLLQEAQQPQDSFMRWQTDLLAKIHEGGLIARRAESHADSPFYCTNPMFAPGVPSGASLIGP